MQYMDQNFWLASVGAGRPLALQPEGGSALTNLNWTKMGWGFVAGATMLTSRRPLSIPLTPSPIPLSLPPSFLNNQLLAK
jgi:hypothetical protein